MIDRAVKFVADKVKAVASRLIAIGDRLIPGFHALRQKFKTLILDRIRAAVATLNRIVNAVKDGIKKAFQVIGKALQAGLDLLKKGMQAAINAVKSAVKAAIDKAKAIIATLGTFASLIKDIAANPGQWLSNLGSAIMDGIKNHLWAALKTAVQGWFNDKVEELLGLGKSVWNLLTKGGIALAQVGKMAWEGLKAAIPPALIALLVERLVAMIVPAAGAIMAIISGLQAAWGAIQRIMTAIDRFVAFLKAVKSGSAGPAFATALAAAAVAVIEFVAQFLLRKIAGAAKKVAGKIKAIAQKIGQRLMAALKKVGGAIKRGATRVVNAVKRGATKVRDKLFGKKTPEQKAAAEEKAKKAKEERLKKAEQAIRSALNRGIRGRALKVWMTAIKLGYRLSSLTVDVSGTSAIVHARINPELSVPAHMIVLDTPVSHDPDTGDAAALTTYFRTVSVAEFAAIKAGKQIMPRLKETRSGAAQAKGGDLPDDQRGLHAPDRRPAGRGRARAGRGQIRHPAPDRDRGRRAGRPRRRPADRPGPAADGRRRDGRARSRGPPVPAEGRARRRGGQA